MLSDEDIRLTFEELAEGFINRRRAQELSHREATLVLELIRLRRNHELAKLRAAERKRDERLRKLRQQRLN